MRPEKESVPVNRPDLEEFLSALDGFLDKKTTPKDPGYLKFLEIFCRSVGAGQGHLLRAGADGRLVSILSFATKPGFDEEFNKAHVANASEPCPLDVAFDQKQVIAMVEVKKGPELPDWFFQLMDRRGFKSLVAVPLIGQTETSGVLCAYYHDICLFDRGTLDQLLVMGRMVGAATENSRHAQPAPRPVVPPPFAAAAPAPASASSEGDENLDRFLEGLLEKPFNKLQAFGLAGAFVQKAFDPCGVLVGPVRKLSDELVLTVADARGLPSSVVSHRFVLPPLLDQRLKTGRWPRDPNRVSSFEWGELSQVIKGAMFRLLCQPLVWQGKPIGVLIVWRNEGAPFDEKDDALLNRFAKILSLASNS